MASGFWSCPTPLNSSRYSYTLVLYHYCTTTVILLYYHFTTTVILLYYCTTALRTVILLYYCTTIVILLYYYGITTVLLYYYCTHPTALHQASEVVDCGGECRLEAKAFRVKGFSFGSYFGVTMAWLRLLAVPKPR